MKKLRTKIIAAVFLSSAVIFALTFLLVCCGLITYHNRQADGMTLIISTYGGEVPLMQEYEEAFAEENMPSYSIAFSEESAFRTRYFVVTLDAQKTVVSLNLEHVASIDEDVAKEMSLSVLSGEKEVGYYDIYRYRIVESADTIDIIFLDCEENFTFRRAAMTIIGILSICFPLLITIIFGFFSKRVIVPFEENTRRQKQFITDASHELKTPLAIISANAEVLAYKVGENEWTRNITDQTAHMGELIDDLLTLARMEESDENPQTESVNFSKTISEIVHDFYEVFNQKQVTLTADIAEDIYVSGNAKQLAMLVSILVENASKYVTVGGRASISLRTTSRHVIFEISNTAVLDPQLDVRRLFGRFYRPDSSRASKTGGQGIGLSTALKITQLHNGSISASAADDGIQFLVKLPLPKTHRQ